MLLADLAGCALNTCLNICANRRQGYYADCDVDCTQPIESWVAQYHPRDFNNSQFIAGFGALPAALPLLACRPLLAPLAMPACLSSVSSSPSALPPLTNPAPAPCSRLPAPAPALPLHPSPGSQLTRAR